MMKKITFTFNEYKKNTSSLEELEK